MQYNRLKTSKRNVQLNSVILPIFIILSIILGVYSVCYADTNGTQKEQEIKEKVEKILSSKEFTDPKKKLSVIEMIADKVKELREWIDEKLKGKIDSDRFKLKDPKVNTSVSPMTDAVFKMVGIGIIVLFIVLILFFVFRNMRRSKSVKVKEDAELLTILKDPDSVEQQAMELYYKGDFQQALRFLYISMLLKFNELNIIRIDKAKTNKQYLKEVLESGFHGYDTVKEFTADFNRYWYGNQSVDKSKFDYWHTQYTSLIKEGQP